MPHIKIGDTVLLTSVNRNVPGGLYDVTKPSSFPTMAMSSNIASRVRAKSMSASRAKAN